MAFSEISPGESVKKSKNYHEILKERNQEKNTIINNSLLFSLSFRFELI